MMKIMSSRGTGRRRVASALFGAVLSAVLSTLDVGRSGDILADGSPQPILPTVELMVGEVALQVEIASTGQQRYAGLSFRESLDEGAGMLFVYPKEQPLVFTMRNTLLPLSIAFIDADLVIDEIIDMDVGPGQLFPSRAPAQFALEVNQGWFERHDIEVGTRLSMP